MENRVETPYEVAPQIPIFIHEIKNHLAVMQSAAELIEMRMNSKRKSVTDMDMAHPKSIIHAVLAISNQLNSLYLLSTIQVEKNIKQLHLMAPFMKSCLSLSGLVPIKPMHIEFGPLVETAACMINLNCLRKVMVTILKGVDFSVLKLQASFVEMSLANNHVVITINSVPLYFAESLIDIVPDIHQPKIAKNPQLELHILKYVLNDHVAQLQIKNIVNNTCSLHIRMLAVSTLIAHS
ncbi:MAG: hypothetical protein ACOYKE_03290 [Ferruginibacter sp.]